MKIDLYAGPSHTVLLCTIAISAQSGLGPAYYYNFTTDSPQAAVGIHYGVSGTFCSTKTLTNGVQHRSALLVAKNASNEPIGLDFGDV